MAGGVAAVIVAAGRGIRAGGDQPKAYRALGGQPMIRFSLALFAGSHFRNDEARTKLRDQAAKRCVGNARHRRQDDAVRKRFRPDRERV